MRTLFMLCLAISGLVARNVSGQQSFNGIEIIQSVQSLQQDVPLIAGKPTLIRVYVDGVGQQGEKLGGIINVTSISTGQLSTLHSINSVDFMANAGSTMISQHDDLAKSLNFVLPPELTGPGQLSITQVRLVDGSSGRAIPCAPCSSLSRSAFFSAAPVLKIKVIFVGYSLDSQSPLAYPSDEDLEAIKSWLTRAYPTSRVQISKDEIYASQNGLSGKFFCYDLNDVLNTVRNHEINNGAADPQTHYYGLVSDAYYFMPGCSPIVNRPDVWLSSSGPAGNPAAHKETSWDTTDHTFAGWYAGHEIAHVLGRGHPDPGICGEIPQDPSFPYKQGHPPEAYVGLDIGSSEDFSVATALPGLSWTDVMTYCPKEWISPYTYEGILDREKAQDAATTGATTLSRREEELKATPAGYIDIMASVNLTKSTAEFKDVQRSAIPSFPLTGETGPATVRTLDSEGHVLTSAHTEIFVNSDIPRNADKRGVIETSIPYDDRISLLQLIIGEGPPAATFSAGGRRARVSDLSLKSAGDLTVKEFSMMMLWGQDKDAGSNILVQWAPAGEGVTYTVEATPKGGRTWNTLAVSLKQSFAVINPRRMGLKDGQSLTVRVTAKDGFKSSAVESKSITVGTHKPSM